MPSRPNCLLIAIGLALVAAPVNGQFTGTYAPETWIIGGAEGSASATFSVDGSSLTIIGPDDGGSGHFIDVLHFVNNDGTWSFNWTWTSVDIDPYVDIGYYLINGQPFFLSDLAPGTRSGSVSVDVDRGDVIGWRVWTLDGVYGPGSLTITSFQIPTPGALGLIGLAGLLGANGRRRCRTV